MKNSFTSTKKKQMKEYIAFAIVAFLSLLTPIKGFIIIVGLFVWLDTITAIYVSVKLFGWDSFKSNKLFNVVIKLFFYFSTIILAFLIDKYIFGGTIIGIRLLISKVISLLYVYVEIKSLDENSIRLNNPSFWTILKQMLRKGKQLKTDISALFEEDKKKAEEKITEDK